MYITTAIAYLNGKPHFGHVLEIVQADCLARFYRLLGKEVVFQTGSDEHGTKIYSTALAQNMDPKELVDRNCEEFKKIYRRLNVSYDRFVRTTSEVHKAGARKLWMKMLENGDLYKSEYNGLYCIGCESYKTANELVDGKCPYHPNRELIELKEENYFFRLTRYIDKLIDIYEKGIIKIVPERRTAEVLSLLKEGMEDISFSRLKKKLPWGIPVPNDDEHVMYVWADALSNYITNVGYAYNEEEFRSIWPADIHLIGKDIVKFHAIYWPAMLMSAGLELPRSIFVHGFLMMEGMKIGKSVGNVSDPNVALDRYGTDPLRFYLLRNVPSSDDGSFKESDLIDMYNNTLANDLGNLILRVASFIKKDFKGRIPRPSVPPSPVLKELIGQFDFTDELKKYFDSFQLHKAVERVWKFIKEINRVINEVKPWQLKKEGKIEEYAVALHVFADALRAASIYLKPFIPGTSEKIAAIFGFPKDMTFKDVAYNENTEGILGEIEVLFPKISTEKKKDPLSVFNFKVGKIETAEYHPESSDILVLGINVGDKKITVCAKIGKDYKPEDVIGKTPVVLTNVKARDVKGITSEGMLLGAIHPETGKIELAYAEGEPGEWILIGDIEPEEDVTVPSKRLGKTKIRAMNNRVRIGNNFLKTRSGKYVTVNLPDGVRLT